MFHACAVMLFSSPSPKGTSFGTQQLSPEGWNIQTENAKVIVDWSGLSVTLAVNATGLILLASTGVVCFSLRTGMGSREMSPGRYLVLQRYGRIGGHRVSQMRQFSCPCAVRLPLGNAAFVNVLECWENVGTSRLKMRRLPPVCQDFPRLSAVDATGLILLASG